MSGGAHFSGMAGPRVSGMSGGPRFSGSRFAGAPFAHTQAAFSPRFSGRFHHRRFNRFAFVGGYAAYDSCWRRAWTPYGLQWVNVCTDYGY